MPTLEDIIWAAAFFEAEGSVAAYFGSGKYRNSLAYKIQVHQKDAEIPEWFVQKFAGRVHVNNGKYNALGGVVHYWELIGSKAFDFLAMIHPHLKGERRRDSVEDMLKIWISRPVNHGDDRARCELLCLTRRGRRDQEVDSVPA